MASSEQHMEIAVQKEDWEGGEADGAPDTAEGTAPPPPPPPHPAAAACEPGTLWNMHSKHRAPLKLRNNGAGFFFIAGVSVSGRLFKAWFPGASLPMPISLQILIDGTPLGPRFHSNINKSGHIRVGLSPLKDQLVGCHMQAFRAAAAIGGPGAPPALDLLLSSPSSNAATTAPAATHHDSAAGNGAHGGDGGVTEAAAAGDEGNSSGDEGGPADCGDGWDSDGTGGGGPEAAPAAMPTTPAAAAAAALRAKTGRRKPQDRGWEEGDLEAGVFPVNQTFTANDYRSRRLRVSAHFFPNSTPPEALRVQVVLDGAPAGDGPLKVTAKLHTKSVHCYMQSSRDIPIPLGAHITQYRLIEADFVEVRARSRGSMLRTEEEQAEQQADGDGDGGSGSATAAGGGGGGKRQRRLEPLQPADQPQPPGGNSPAVPQTPAASAAAAAVAVATPHPPAAAPAAVPTGTAEDGATALAAELRALDLQRIELSPAADERAAAAALETAVFEAYGEVERAATALGLPFAMVDAVCRYVNAATVQPLAARRFVLMEYRRLVRAAAEGEVGVARAWMERAAAAAAAAAR